VNGEPRLDELIDAEVTGVERERLKHVHELLLRVGPPPEVSPDLAGGPSLAMTLGRRPRAPKPRALMLLAAALVIAIVFVAGYVSANNGGGGPSATKQWVRELALKGTAAAPNAQASLQIWHSKAGNWPMTLNVVGLPKLRGHGDYEVYLVRDGKPWGSCGTFRVTGQHRAVSVTLNAPYSLRPGDSWVVTRSGPRGFEPGKTVLRPVTT
jgi:hypothetical protein